VIPVDAYGPGNSRSSSGGETRLLRADCGDKVVYTNLALHAFNLWETMAVGVGCATACSYRPAFVG
jgi:hypothetical protein